MRDQERAATEKELQELYHRRADLEASARRGNEVDRRNLVLVNSWIHEALADLERLREEGR